MSFGKGGGTTITTPSMTQEQKDLLNVQTGAMKDVFLPTYENVVKGAGEVFGKAVPGYGQAAQNLSAIANQVAGTSGAVGESALKTGTAGLENLFNNDYVQQQLQAAMMPAQAQYTQNLAGLNAGFGGAGQLGSARNALANTQLAGQTQGAQMQAAANVLKDIQSGRLAAGQALAGIGQQGLGQALGAAGTNLAAAGSPLDLYNKYASVAFGAPSAQVTPNFGGTQGSTVSGSNYKFGLSMPTF